MSRPWMSWIQSTVQSAGDRIVNWLNENNIEVQVEYYDGNQRYRRVISGPNRQPALQGFIPVDSPPSSAGLTDDQIASFSSVFDYIIGAQEDLSCTICMEEFKEGDRVRILPCFHQYHVGCVDEWLHQHPDCPICKLSLVNR